MIRQLRFVQGTDGHKIEIASTRFICFFTPSNDLMTRPKAVEVVTKELVKIQDELAIVNPCLSFLGLVCF
jgi:hypothetical protein